MAEMTAEQAAEWERSPGFRVVWEILQEVGRKQAETTAQIKELSANIGGVNHTLGKWSEEMVAAKLCEKINVFGYEFTRCARNIKYRENGKKLAEVDCFLENGDFVMPVETKTDLTPKKADEYLEKVQKIRHYMNCHDDKRTILGGMAGAIVPDSVCKYAQKKGSMFWYSPANPLWPPKHRKGSSPGNGKRDKPVRRLPSVANGDWLAAD